MEKYRNFEDYLQEKHIKENPTILDDDLPDAFDDWVAEIDVDAIIEHADAYAKIVREEALNGK